MDFNESGIIDATWEPTFVDEVKGHIMITNHVKFLVSFEKLMSDLDQTWVIDATWDPSLVDK